MRALLIACSTLILGGCFYSDNALIGRRLAQFPLEDGVYSHTPYDENGQSWALPAWTGEIRRRGWIYSSEIVDFPHQGSRMREINPGIYAVMKPSDGYYVYGVMFLYPGGIATYHMPSCSALEDAAIAVYQVERDDDGYCEIPSWSALSSVLQLYLAAVGDDMKIDGIYRRIDQPAINLTLQAYLNTSVLSCHLSQGSKRDVRAMMADYVRAKIDSDLNAKPGIGIATGNRVPGLKNGQVRG